MKMTLKDAANCLGPGFSCDDCKFNNQDEFNCRGAALEMGVTALNFLLVEQKLSQEAEGKDR